jgi:DNA-binding NtrC family response regulator
MSIFTASPVEPTDGLVRGLELLLLAGPKVDPSVLRRSLEADGVRIVPAASRADAIAALARRRFDAILTADASAVAVLRRERPEVPLVVLAPEGTVEEAVQAMRQGAFDYVAGPSWETRLRRTLVDVMRLWAGRDGQEVLDADLARAYRFEGVVGRSRAMRDVLRIASVVAPTDATVLITGESGTGKELLVRSIHVQSRRASGPLVVMHCGAIPETLLETEIFGHEKGAYTHALGSRPGKFEQAHGGTIFLDEIGEMSLRMQVKLLRVLQERVVERVGSTRPIRVDCRVIAATNRDLRRMVAERTFREDLYYRLNVVSLRLPPLRERMEDLPLLVHFFVQKYRRQIGKAVRGITDSALRKLLDYSWPGNIRELEAVIHRAVILVQGEWIDADDIRLDWSPYALSPAV